MKRSLMRRLISVVVLALALPASTVHVQATGINTTLERRIQAADLPPAAELFHTVLDFEPGAWTIVHSHNGPSYNTVLEGQITLRIGDVEQTFMVGQGWVDEPEVVHTAGNQGTVPARLIATFVVQRGIPPSSFIEPDDESSLPPEPTFVATQKMNAFGLSGPMDVIHRVIELAPGSVIPLHSNPGPSLVSVLEGTVLINMNGEIREGVTGESWTEVSEVLHSYTAGDVATRIVITTFVPRGALVINPS